MEKINGTPRSTRSFLPRAGLAQLIVTGCAVAAVGAAGYYGVGLLRSYSFNNDRAFRVLHEMVAQVENFQGTMVSLINLIPESVDLSLDPDDVNCNGPSPVTLPDEARGCKFGWRRYANKLNVPDIELSRVSRIDNEDKFMIARDCKGRAKGETSPELLAVRYDLLVRVDDPNRRFTIHPCAVRKDSHGILELRGKLQSGLPRFVSQSFFDEALVTMRDGTVLATIPGTGSEIETAQVELQDAGGQGVIIANARELLRAAAQAINSDSDAHGDAKAPTPPASDGGTPHLVVFDKTIAAKKYRVFVVPFQPSVPWYIESVTGEQPPRLAHQDVLYIVGLKQARWSQQIAYELWPDGAFAVAVGSLLAVLMWPLLRLKCSNRLEPISRTIAFAAIVSFILVPGVASIGAVWAWSRVALINWADTGARTYAAQIESYVISELETATGLLDRYRDVLYSKYSGKPCEMIARGDRPAELVNTLPVGHEDLDRAPDGHEDLDRADRGASRQIVIQSDKAVAEPQACDVLYLWEQTRQPRERELGAWSPLRTVVALGADGQSYGPRLTAFGRVPLRMILALPDREYFRALLVGEAWRPEKRADRGPRGEPRDTRGGWKAVPSDGFVAQRLFSRADAARPLQVAVPRRGAKDEFLGAIVADSQVYGLTASVAPLLLRFAIVDSGSGAVLFHSNDSRSLVENFFVETENSSELREKLRRRTARRDSHQPWLEELSSGRYLGEPHRFYVRPVSGVPWSLVVFYSTKELGDVSFQAGVGALVTYVIFAACPLLLIAVLAPHWLAGRAGRLPRWLWPRRAWRAMYPWFAWLGIGLVVVFAALGLWRFGYGHSTLMLVLASNIIVAFAVAFYRRPRKGSTKDLSQVRPKESSNADASETAFAHTERAYVLCLLASVLLVSALPATWLALHFHDLSVQTFVYSGLVSAGRQVVSRRVMFGEDLRRWGSGQVPAQVSYPDTWKLTDKLPVPGLQVDERERKRQTGHTVRVSEWRLSAFNGIPWANVRSGPPGDSSLLRLVWSATRDSPVPARSGWTQRDRRGNEVEDRDAVTGRNVAEDREEQLDVIRRQREYDRHRMRLVVRGPAPDGGGDLLETRSQTEERESIPWALRSALALMLAAATIYFIYRMALIVARRLLGSQGVFLYGPDATRPAEARRNADAVTAIWESLDSEDRLLLHQLAKGQLANPANTEGIGRLAKLGLIKFDPWLKIADRGLEVLANRADDKELENLLHEASASAWNSIRTPLLIVMLVVVGLLLYVSSTSMQIVTTVLAGVASLLGYVSQYQGFIRGSGGAKAE